MNLREQYQWRRDNVLVPLATNLEVHLKSIFGKVPRIDRIGARAKDVDRFIAKAEKEVDGVKKYSSPLRQIQDQVGARIIAFYTSDVEYLISEIPKYFTYIEARRMVPESPHAFGYEGHHFILCVPNDIIDDKIASEHQIDFFELQIKTLFQHAWSESGHDLAYKPVSPLTNDQNRRLAFTAAQAWGADHMFEDLLREAGVAGDLPK